jgi:hypothetical protein
VESKSKISGCLEKYIVVLLEQGVVVLLIKYVIQNDLNDQKVSLPQISLIKQNGKVVADCICANLRPSSKQDSCPSFWIAKDNWIQLVEIDTSKPQKIIPARSIKYEYDKVVEGHQAAATAIRQSYLK